MLDYRIYTFLTLFKEMNYRKTAEKLNMTQPGVTQHIQYLEKHYGVKLFEYTPLQVKQAVAGYGRAEKKQVITMVTSLLRLPAPPKPDDTADALAIAVCHGHSGASRLAKYYNN